MKNTTKPWLEVDRDGLSKLMERKNGKRFVMFELIQNIIDEDSTVGVVQTEYDGKKAHIVVSDDNPTGFLDLSHAFTLFAESAKKTNPEKRGRFNLGEKLVLACCSSAKLSSTTGTILWDAKGRRHSKEKRQRGSVFEANIPMSKSEYLDMLSGVRDLIVPPTVEIFLNGEKIGGRDAIVEFESSLQTEVADRSGVLRPTTRITNIGVYETLNGRPGAIYELGIPVVETGDKYDINIHQKVPLNMDRDNVTPSYLKAIRVLVLNQTANLLKEEETTSIWVRDAASDIRCSPEAIKTVMEKRFGEKAVSFDPSDIEGSKIAISKGYNVIHGGSLSKGEWENVRRIGLIVPAGQVTPSPKPFDPEGRPLKTISNEELSGGMIRFNGLAKELAKEVLNSHLEISVVFSNDRNWPFRGAFGEGGTLYVNVSKFPSSHFDELANGSRDAMRESVDFLIHEFGHWISPDHLSEDYHRALTSIGAKVTILALTKPSIFH